MKKIFCMLSAALLCGCATTQSAKVYTTSPDRPAKTAVSAENYGYYLFSAIPLFTGNPDRPNDVSMKFFSDTVNIENNQKMIFKEAEKLGAGTLSNINNSTDWTGSFSLWIVWKQVLYSNATHCAAAPRRAGLH